MERETMLGAVDARDSPWDMIIVGGGATGLGTAVEAASRVHRPLLPERAAFGTGTSSRRTKLAHGGVRYLQQGNISLVLEALTERGLLLKNAPHLIRNLAFVVPNYDWWEGPFYGVGLKLYDVMAGKQGFGRSRMLSREKTQELIPTIETEGLGGGVIYHDGQFDDARMAVALARTAAGQGAVLVNYAEVLGLLKEEGEVRGVRFRDLETGIEREAWGRVVVNATGPYTDAVRRMDDPEARPMIIPSQGAHIVLDRSFLPGDSAIMVPKTDDGRVLFAIPWLGRVVVGTTDTPLEDVPDQPRPLDEEVEFLLEHAARYLIRNPEPEDILSTFAGIRPLVGSADETGGTAALSRDHTLHISPDGLLTVTGGKWTTYRRMAEDTVDQASLLAEIEERPSVTRNLPIQGFHQNAEEFGDLAPYGSDAPAIRRTIQENDLLGERIHPDHPVLGAQVVWAAREEMARTVEDVLSRRVRMLLLDARAAMEAAPRVAELLAAELGRGDGWREAQVEEFRTLAKEYLPGNGAAAGRFSGGDPPRR